MSKATKHDAGKPRLELLPPNAMFELAKVMTAGAEKYGAHNYLGGMDHGRLIGAALRHIFSHLMGEDYDELGTLHLSNAAIDLIFVIEYMKRGIGTDDRYKAPGSLIGINSDGSLVRATKVVCPPADDIGFNLITPDGIFKKVTLSQEPKCTKTYNSTTTTPEKKCQCRSDKEEGN